MENEHVLSGLTRKRAEIAGKIEHAQAALRKLVGELDALDIAIRIFDPQADTGAIKPKVHPPRHRAFRGEMTRHVLEILRKAEKPVTTRAIANAVMSARGLNVNDSGMVTIARKRVRACVWNLKRAAHVREVAGVGDLKEWALAE